MSLLVVAPVSAPRTESLRTTDGERIASELAARGVQFERWKAGVALADGASQEDVLAAYRVDVDRVAAEGPYPSVDVVRLRPDASDATWPEKAKAARDKFLAEHTHAEDEVRFFVEGRGIFYLRFGDEVSMVLCERGDRISVPARTRHWFDMGTAPAFCAIRFFGTTEGWKAEFTGSDVAKTFPTFDELASSVRPLAGSNGR